MSDNLNIESMTVEELEARLVENQILSKEERDAREERGRVNRNLKHQLARKTAQCWVLASVHGGSLNTVMPVSEKVPSHYMSLIFTTDPELTTPVNATVVPKLRCKEVKIQIRTDVELDPVAFVRLQIGQSITVGVDSMSAKKTIIHTEYGVQVFATEAEALAKMQELDNSIKD